MKKRDIYLIVVILFLVIMIFIITFFYRKYNNTILVNESKDLLSDLYTLESGNYELKNGILYNSNNEIVNDKEYIKSSGYIYIDKYNNVSFKLNKDNSCISKTYLGNIKYENNNCSEFKSIDVKMVKNNANISFITNERLEYMTSNKDDFKGKWIKQLNNSNIIIKSYNEGKNYIWFKDKDGNLSKTYTFSIDCLNTTNAEYKNNVFYCSGSTVNIDNIKWVVIEDNNTIIKLMKFYPVDYKIEFTNDLNSFKWSTSVINNYLNNEFINSLSTNTQNKLLTNEICDDYYNIYCNGEVCGGRSKEEMERDNYVCTSYTSSKIKIISYDEFNYVYSKTKNKNVLNGNYWSINSLNLGNGCSIQYNHDYYLLEKPNNKLDVKPVIIINK